MPGNTLDASGFIVLGHEQGPHRRIRLWPDAVAYHRERPGVPWRETTVEIRLETPRKLLKSVYPGKYVPACGKIGEKSLPQQHVLFPDFRDLRTDLADLYFSVPERVRTAVSCLGSNQWIALKHADAPGAVDVYQTSAALAIAVLLSEDLDGHSLLHEEPEVFLRKRKDIAGLLGFPSTNWVVAVFNKLSPDGLDAVDLAALQKATADPFASRLLRHVPRPLDRRFVGLLADTSLRCIFTNTLLLEIASSNQRGSLANQARQLARYHRELTRFGEMRFGRPVTKVSQLGERLERARRVWDRIQGCVGKEEEVYPEPPVPPAPDIHPLRTVGEVARECLKQDLHCLASMAFLPFSREGWFYRVERPTRATAWITHEKSGWALADLRERHNSRPARKTITAVRKWLREARRQAGSN